MCGIAGIISSNSSLISQQRLKAMSDALAHRGPDGESQWFNLSGTVCFAHRRLAIIDRTETGRQPMHYLDRYTIVHNGEIYNYIELKETLAKKGYSFTSSSDTEVILAAYDCYREKCVEHFDGMFTFAIWDEKEQALFAARDRFGEKPFFYYYDKEQLIFASEMKALWAAGVKKEANRTLLYNYLTLGYTCNPADLSETFYTNISKLPAASYLKYHLTANTLETGRYWDIDRTYTDNTISEKEAIEKFQHLFHSSIQKRLRSDVSVGTSLSGGLDSSSIVAMICRDRLNDSQNKLTNTVIQTFSAVFPGFEKDESRYQQLVAGRYGVENHAITPTADEMMATLDKLCYHQEEPFQSSSIFAQYKVFELAKQYSVTVLLDGQGADEILAGYDKYYSRKSRVLNRLPVISAIYIERLKAVQQKRNRYLSKSFKEDNGHSYYQFPLRDQLNTVLYYNTFINGLEELLRYADRNSMAHGREVRLPFLQHELVEFVFSLPEHFKIRNGFGKWLLRQSMQDYLPDAITGRKDKIGFEPPQQQWMRTPALQEKIQEAKRVLVKKDILDKAVLNHTIRPQGAHEAGNYDWRFLSAAIVF
ncbi:MAG TPA: asparagine synthase (glutamine-hydrolyzing) [Chitinophagaceae bacterium]|nr:asparagine synthase (glutamine-hydrolyzing) [Chitinophagaceae bacterium]